MPVGLGPLSSLWLYTLRYDIHGLDYPLRGVFSIDKLSENGVNVAQLVKVGILNIWIHSSDRALQNRVYMSHLHRRKLEETQMIQSILCLEALASTTNMDPDNYYLESQLLPGATYCS